MGVEASPAHSDRISCAAFLVLGFLGAMPPLTMQIFIPSLPSLQTSLNTSPVLVLLTVSVYQATFAVMQLIIGPLSDVLGRRILLLTSMASYVAFSAVAAVSPNVYFLLPVRAGQAVGVSGALVLSSTILRDRFSVSARERIIANLAPMRSLAPLFAPILGSFLEVGFGWRSSFLALSLFGAVALAGAWHTMHETLPLNRRQPKLRCSALIQGYIVTLSRRDFMCYAMAEGFGIGGLFFWIASSSFILQEFYRIPIAYFGVFYSITFVGSIIGSFISFRLRKALGISPRSYYLAGSTFNAVTGLLLLILAASPLSAAPTLASQVWLQFCMFLYAVGSSTTMVQAQVQALEPFPSRAGTVAGLMGAIRSLFSCAVGVVAGVLHDHLDHTPRPMCVAICIMSWSKVLIFLLLRPPLPLEEPSSKSGDAESREMSKMLDMDRLECTAASFRDTELAIHDLKQAHEAAIQDDSCEKFLSPPAKD